MEHRRLGQAAHDLVRARDDQVALRPPARVREDLVKGHVRSPRLIHHQRHAVRVRHLDERAMSATAPKYVGEITSAPTAPGVASSAASSVSGARQWAMPSSSSTSGAANVGRMPDNTSASIVLECALRCTTIRSPRWASARPAARLPCEAPLIRNHARLAPHASAASRCASSNGVGVAAHVDPVRQRGDVHLSAASRTPPSAPRRRPGHPCGRGRAGAPGRAPRTAQRVQVRRLLLAPQLTARDRQPGARREHRSVSTGSSVSLPA